ncbi:hypothetical protein M3182_07330 [Mesobacillus maritimus]|uniref:hypothetical protein n=1 Tax=Mesobacillus maritimus TaxID=1643336 RepID=UPI002041E22B|nr:hypothetical protein [Mesobacillus maritimus]MCM3585559.1 hypothetical protein [Mesobacillus maritimus]MCM3669031.1 hypothetical protein [Mesobacillus maritimus]
MRKLFSVLISLALLFPLFLIVDAKSTSAACYNPFTVTPNGDIVEPYCSSGKLGPVGWSSVRSGARYSHTTSAGTKIYYKSGGSAQASSDFNTKVAPTVPYRKYVKDDGSVTLVKSPPEGDVRFYKSSSGSEPSLWWGKEKIRY